MFKVTWSNIKSALVSGVITGVLAIAGYIIGLGDVFAIDIHSLVNVGALAVLTTVVSLVKSWLTTDAGKFVGAVEIK
jgi:hypothetical protein